MFERLAERVVRLAERRARERIVGIAEQIKTALPRGIAAQGDAEGVWLEGRGLRRRFALEPALRWLIAGLPSGSARGRR